jgi:hypothetical protein
MRIEHWHSQWAYPAEALDYANLLGACLGGEGQPWTKQHCDVRKGKRNLSKNPATPMHRVAELLRFRGDGQIISDNPTFDQEINDVLNLNGAFLRSNRKSALDGFLGMVRKRGDLSRITLERWLRDWNGESDSGQLHPFCQVVVYWLRKRLARV